MANVKAQGLPRSPADEVTAQLSHVVDLQSLEEDRLNETLSVVWELEVGHSVNRPQDLPDHLTPETFDDPTTLAGFVDAMRWGTVTSADPNRYQASVPSIHTYGTQIRQALLEKGVLVAEGPNLRLTEDYLFPSPSTAAMVLLGRTANGRIEWKAPDGTTLKELQSAGLPDAEPDDQ